MTITKGSGQGSGGKGLLVTALTAGTAQTLHTAVAGVGVPQLFRCLVNNPTDNPVTVTIRLEPSDLSAAVEFKEVVGAKQEKFLFDNLEAIPLNDSIVVKVYASVASTVYAWAIISDQAATPQTQQWQTGEVTLVQNTNAFRFNGVASSATEADHQLLAPVAGTIGNLRARATANIGNGATVTVTARINGVDSALSFTYAVADTTAMKADTGTVSVAAGDLISINFATNNAGAPASTMLGTLDFVPA